MQYFESLFDIPHVTKTLEKSAENDEIASKFDHVHFIFDAVKAHPLAYKCILL